MKLSKTMISWIVGGLVAAIVIGVGLYVLLGGANTKKVTAQFASAVGVYPGTPVDILGIKVGQVTKVTPHGNHITVEMTYDDKYKLPSNAISVIVANSLVSDRYVQLAPAYKGSGPVLADDAKIPLKRTASPAELDDIYGALDRLSTALGPKGANKNGALTNLIDVGDANLHGNGAALGKSISKLATAAKTLADGRENLFGTVKNLQAFNQALVQSDAQVRHFEEQLAQVSGDLASERGDLGTALHVLAGTLDEVATFVKHNSAKAGTDITGLRKVTDILIGEQASLNETLAVAPTALSNVVHLYQPDLGVLPTRSNLSSLIDSLTNPKALCSLINVASSLPGGLGSLLGPLSKTIATTCTNLLQGLNVQKILDGLGLGSLSSSQLDSLLGALFGGDGQTGGGVLGGLIPTGGGS